MLDFTNREFGKLTAIKRVAYKGWECRCVCGAIKVVKTWALKCGGTRSCGKRGCIERSKLPPNEAGLRQKFLSYILAARKRKLIFQISLSQFREIVAQSCTYCGAEPQHRIIYKSSGPIDFRGSGIDRIDNTKGYSVNNCCACCATCNRAKSDLTIEEWDRWIARIIHHHKTHTNLKIA